MKFVLITVLCFICSLVSSQENSNLKFRSIATGLGLYTLDKPSGGSGLTGTLDVELSLHKHLFAAASNYGLGILDRDDILKNELHMFLEFDLLYGRAITISNDLSFRLYSGVGFTEQTKLKNAESGSSFCIPVRGKLQWKVSRIVRLGIQSHLNFNHQNNIYMYHFFVHFNMR